MKFIAFCVALIAALSLQPSPISAQHNQLVTRWADKVTPDNVLPEYPRPQLVRDQWLNLNGLWDYTVTKKDAEMPTAYEGKILVPFAIESYLSGVQRSIIAKRLWYHRTFTLPSDWAGNRLLINFGAVDWDTTVYINGQAVGNHQGGYDPFSFDITDALKPDGEQTIIVSVWDATEGAQPRGKQVVAPGGIWYTSTTGIWQTVWIEPVASAHIDNLKIDTDIDQGTLTLQANLAGAAANTHYTLKVDVLNGSEVAVTQTTDAAQALTLNIPNPQLWSPDSPFLYDLRVTLQQGDVSLDSVGSYFGMRKIEVKKDDKALPRIFLNNQAVFQYGLLDQGFWPDGLYTAPTDAALRFDIETTKKLGFNLIRKHVKVEPARWYYWADKLGMLVWQDMPSSTDILMEPGRGELPRDSKIAANFEHELQRMIDTHYNSPSIIMWVIFNEGWGQYDTIRLTQWLKAYDPTRIINSASGWNDFRSGDVQDIHRYPAPESPQSDYKRANVLGEFGGLGLPIEGHTWLNKDSWGYKQYTDVPALLDAYSRFIKRLVYQKNERGLSAAIYTQTADVETEVNGIMTYDREIIKMGADNLLAVNQTLFAP